MPDYDRRPRRAARSGLAIALLRSALADWARRNRKRPPGGAQPVPVEPNRPNNLTGGAAAALEFDA